MVQVVVKAGNFAPQGAKGPQGISGESLRGIQGYPSDGIPSGKGVQGSPGPTCICRLDTDIDDVEISGASGYDYLTYDSTLSPTGWTNTKQINEDLPLGSIDFSNIPSFDDGSGAINELDELFKLFRLTDDPNTVRMTLKQKTFVSKWKTDNTANAVSASNQVNLPLTNSGTYDCKIYWGDGTRDVITSSPIGGITHTYRDEGTYTIRIYGQCEGFNMRFFGGDTDKSKIIEVSNWGELFRLEDSSAVLTQNYFYQCPNLKITAQDVLTIENAINFHRMFRNCTQLTEVPRITEWDFSNANAFFDFFRNTPNFDQDLSNLDTSNVVSISNMLRDCNIFNNGGSTGINNWIFPNVTSLEGLFTNAPLFNQPIGQWDVSNITSLNTFLQDASAFNQDLGNWDVSNVENFNRAFSGTLFNNGGTGNTGISDWDVSSATNMSGMFQNAINFDHDLGSWGVTGVNDMNNMFNSCENFNNGGSDSIKNWEVSNVTNTAFMFFGADRFNIDISSWNTSKVTNMFAMFRETIFNQPIGSWDVSNVETFNSMFRGNLNFDQDLSNWNVSSAQTMSQMFFITNFNNAGETGIDNWDVSSVTNFDNMFSECPFNQPIGSWDVSSATTMQSMFNSNSAFDQDIGEWDITGLNRPNGLSLFMRSMSSLSITNYDKLLIGWDATVTANDGPTGMNNVEFGSIKYSGGGAAEAARTNLINVHGWNILDGGTGP